MRIQDFKIGSKRPMGFAAVTMIIILIAAVNIQEIREAERLSNRVITLRVPTAANSSRMNTGVKYALAALRGWILLGDEKFKKQREEAWEQYIYPSLNQMQKLSAHWTNQENVDRLREIEKLLKNFKRFQKEIEDIAQTSENVPAVKLLLNDAVPKAKIIAEKITEMIDLESLELSNNERRALLIAMADVRGTMGFALASIRAYLLTSEVKFKTEFEKQWIKNEHRFAYLQKNQGLFSKNQKKVFQGLKKNRQEFALLPIQMFTLLEDKNWNRANYLLKTKAAPFGNKISTLLEEMVEDQQALLSDDGQDIKNHIKRLNMLVTFIVAVVFLIAAGLLFFIARGATFPSAASLIALARKIASGINHPYAEMKKMGRELTMYTWFYNLNMRTKIHSGNALGIIFLVTFASIVYYNTKILLETSTWVTHTQKTISIGHQLTENLINMETGQRGFLITGEVEFLEPYDNAKNAIFNQLEEAKKLVNDNSNQLRTLVKVEELTHKWLRTSGETEIDARKEVKEGSDSIFELQKIIGEGKGKELLDRIRKSLDELDNTFSQAKDMRGKYLVLSIAKDMVDQETGQRGFLVTGKNRFLEPYYIGQDLLKQHLLELNVLRNKSFDQKIAKEKMEGLKNLIIRWKKEAAEPEIAIRLEINKNETTLRDVEKLVEKKTGKNLMDEIRVHLGKFISTEENLIKERKMVSSQASNQAILLILIGTIGSVIGLLLIGRLIAESISNPLLSFVKVTEAIAEGDLNQKLDIKSKDEIGFLAKTFTKMTFNLKTAREKQKAADEKQDELNWLRKNLVLFTGKIQGAINIKEITDILIYELSVLLKFELASIYFRETLIVAEAQSEDKDKEDKELTLYSTYGYKPPANKLLSYAFGESLVGQCALKRKPLYFNKVKPAPIKIAAGLVKVEASHLILQPIVFEEKLSGIIEIASIDEFTEVEKMFLAQLADQVGIIMNSVRFLERSLKLRDQLVEKAKALEIASKSKSEFLASMSHEIRTPMNAIIGMADLLVETNLTEEQEKYVNTYRYAGENLLNIINDILDLSKIEAGQLELEKTGFNLEELIERTSDIMLTQAQEKSIELAILFMPDLPYALLGDPTRLRQVIINLVGNAIKFTEKGEVVIGVEAREMGEKEAELLFSVKDTGIGIPKDKCEVIFQNFSQVDASTTRKYGGTGLGLSISKLIVGLMDGKIWVESEEGKGSIFYFTAKFGLDNRSKERAESKSMDLKGVRVLIVDDNATNRLILNKALSSWGAETKEATDGKECMDELMNAKKSSQPYNLILLDYMMPEMNGFEVAEKVKNDPEIKAPIVMNSSNIGFSEGKKRANEIGIEGYLHKPIKLSELRRNINIALGKAKPIEQKKIDIVEAVATESPLKILLAEDTKDNRNLILAFLKKSPHGIDIAENGQIAVDKFTSLDYDLVLMDIEMPVMDGYTATRKIRQWEKEQNRKPTSIIALTAHALKEHAERSKEAGCNGHVTKPIKKAKLLEIVREYGRENFFAKESS